MARGPMQLHRLKVGPDWILSLVVFTRFPANRDCLLKLYMSVKSARTVSRELYWEKRVDIGLTSYG